MRLFVMAAAAVLVLGFGAHAGELDGEKSFSTEQISHGKELPRTVVVRIKDGSKQAEVLHVGRKLKASAETHQFVSTSSFIKLDSKGTMELDHQSSSSSWYFSCPNYYYPTYYYYGYQYNYTNYYSYYYSGYHYYYYTWPYC